MHQNICIVSSGTISGGPRVEKEADALAEAGFNVEVLVCHTEPFREKWDREMAATKRWRLSAVQGQWGNFSGIFNRVRSNIRQKKAMLRYEQGEHDFPIPEWAYCRFFSELLSLGKKRPADLYIAHNLAALPVAHELARQAQARLAFDIEDDHYGEFTPEQYQSSAAKITLHIEKKYYPRCDYLTASSEAIANAVQERCMVEKPLVIHNVFPLALRDSIDGKTKDRRGPSLSLYWYSQVAGPGRGLEDIFNAASMIKGEYQIHIRGDIDPKFQSELIGLAQSSPIVDRVHFHAQVPPSQLMSRTVEHDIGLALEPGLSQNRNLCLTNKFFFYLLAGLPVVATSTDGQKQLMSSQSKMGELYSPGDYKRLAQIIQKFIDNRGLAQSMKKEVFQQVKNQWNWEREKLKVVQQVIRVFQEPKIRTVRR